MGRWIGIDYGRKRIGVAICDPTERFVAPLKVLRGSGTLDGDAEQIVLLAIENAAIGIVVGHPLNMDGTAGSQAKLSEKLARALRAHSDLTVELWDERLSSFEAEDRLRRAEIPPGRRRSLLDSLAAGVILESFLEARRENPPPAAPDA